MAAPLGNQFWKLAGDIGRPKKFDTPEQLWELACQYFEWCDNNPISVDDWVGAKATKVTREHSRPYTLYGLCAFLNISFQTWTQYAGGNEAHKEFHDIAARIEHVVKTQQYEGAAAGIFNANIVARGIGLVDKQEQKNETQITGKVGITVVSSGIPLANSESDVNPART